MSDLHLNFVSLDGLTLRRRAATLHSGAGTRAGTRNCAWWVSIACEATPSMPGVGRRLVSLEANTVSGRKLRARVRIVSRRDDAYGTELVLAGLGPVKDESPSRGEGGSTDD